jgi:hypothetical protein
MTQTEAPAEEIARLRSELQAAQDLAASATEYRVLIPEYGGTELLVRRQAHGRADGWGVSTMARGGGRAWTQMGWVEVFSALSVDQLFCWPDPATAIDEARRALAAC